MLLNGIGRETLKLLTFSVSNVMDDMQQGGITVDSTLQIIVNIIAILSFILSVGTIICQWRQSLVRLNIDLNMVDIFHSVDESASQCDLQFTFVNKSTKRLSITKIELIDNTGNYHLCSLTHHYVGERYFPHFPETDIPYTERRFSADFPIVLEGNSAITQIVHFQSTDKKIDISSGIPFSILVTTDRKPLMYENLLYNKTYPIIFS